MWQELIAGGVLLLDWAYHRWEELQYKPPRVEVSIPLVTPGAMIPLLFGTQRIRAPLLVWQSQPYTQQYLDNDDTTEQSGLRSTLTGKMNAPIQVYAMDMLFIAAAGFPDGKNTISQMYSGDLRLAHTPEFGKPLTYLTGIGGGFINTLAGIGTYPIDLTPVDRFTEGAVSFYSGASDQYLINPATLDRSTQISERIYFDGTDPSVIPGFRGLMLVGLQGRPGNSMGDKWIFGASPQLPAYGFEMSSFPATRLSTAATYSNIESNPVDAIYRVLVGQLGELGLSSSLIDSASFAAAATVLDGENHGYSRSVESEQDADALIAEILAQIDGMLFRDAVTGLYRIRLVRQDYDPASVPVINAANCEELDSVNLSGFSGLPNRIRVKFPNRGLDYRDDAVTGQNPSGTAGQNGEPIEVALTYPGCCTSALAQTLANRELAARSRPIAKLTAIVSRQFYATNPGDVVAIDWPDYGWSGLLFRVASVSRGTLADGTIKLGLIQEYFQTYRGVHQPVRVVSFPPAVHSP